MRQVARSGKRPDASRKLTCSPEALLRALQAIHRADDFVTLPSSMAPVASGH